MRTGVPGLDELLGGGILEGRSTLIKGPPGSGKTTLGLQMLVAGALEYDEPGIMLTFELIPSQLVADGVAMGWDLKALAESDALKVFFVKPAEILESPGRQENHLLMMIEDWAAQTGARRLLIDSISHLRDLYTGEDARALFMNFLIRIKEMGLNPIMSAERISDGGENDIDAYLADNVFLLNYAAGGVGRPDRREIEILKTRGHGHVPGSHPFEVGVGGVTIFPHMYPEAGGLEAAPAPLGEHLSSGCAGLDDLLGGGFAPRTTILVAGLSGTFKTTLAGHFFAQSASAEAPGLWVSFRESQAELNASLSSMGVDIGGAADEGRIRFLKFVPGTEPLEKLLYRIESEVKSNDGKLIVIDSMNEMLAGIEGDEGRREAVLWTLERLRNLGQTVLLTQGLENVVGRNPLSEIMWADLSDTIVFLGLVEIESRLEKVVSVLKHRGGSALGDLCSIVCTPEGLKVSDRFLGLSGLLGGSASGQRKAQIENIFQPLYFIRDFLTMTKDASLDHEKRVSMLDNLSGQTEKLIAVLSDHFDIPVRGKDGSGDGGGS